MFTRTRGDPLAASTLLRCLALLIVPAVLLACSDSNSADNNMAPSDPRHTALRAHADSGAPEPAEIEIFAPDDGDRVGVEGIGWFVDIAVDFEGNLKSTGFKGNQLTGPGVHNNAPPFPGNFAAGVDDRFPGLVVLISTTSVGARSCQNLADLFNLTGVTNRKEGETEIWDTWIIGAPAFGRHTSSTLYVAEVADLNHNGIHDDAPAVVTDANHDGSCNADDLEAIGLDSEVGAKTFFIL